MLTQEKYIKSVKGRKIKIQKLFVKILRFFNSVFFIKIKKTPKKVQDYTYLTICRRSDFDMVLASIYSLFKNSSILPNRIVIVSDGTWNSQEGVLYFKKHGADVDCVNWDECAFYYKESCPSLTKWAQGHIWGKKMSAILYFSEKSRVLFSDPDILWYNTPLTNDEFCNTKLKLSIDNSHNYDDEFIKAYNYEKLYATTEPINCGVVYIRGGLALLSEDALRCIDYEAEHCGKFAEQTVFAIMDFYYNNRWSMEQITSEISDLLKSFFSKTIFYDNMIARHYLWRLKWIYWKDLTKMRLK